MLRQLPRQETQQVTSTAAPHISERQRIQQQLAGYVVESRLEQGYPRLVRSEPLPFRPIYLLACCSYLLGGGEFLRWGTVWLEKLFFWTVTLAFAALSVVSVVRIVRRLQDRFHVPLLRYGRAVPAVLLGVRTAAGKTWIDFAYLDRYGDLQIGSQRVNKPRHRWKHYGPGSRFTLLVLPEDETRVLTYFLAREYDVVPVEATALSKRLSAQQAMQTPQSSAAATYSMGIVEPELCGSSPRRVRSKPWFRHPDLLGILLATMLTLTCLHWSFLVSFLAANKVLLLLGPYLLPGMFHFSQTDAPKHSYLLRSGIAVRAKVTNIVASRGDADSSPERPVVVCYAYETAEGKVYEHHFSMKRRRMWQLDIHEGATFTVLYHAASPGFAEPYFALRDAEIIGATGARVTPARKIVAP